MSDKQLLVNQRMVAAATVCQTPAPCTTPPQSQCLCSCMQPPRSEIAMSQGHEGTAAAPTSTAAGSPSRAAAGLAEHLPPRPPTLHASTAGEPTRLMPERFPQSRTAPCASKATGACPRTCSSVALPAAERQFSRDLAFALWLPLVLAAFVTRSCGHSPAACAAQRSQGWALEGFPCGGNAAAQVSRGRGC